MRNLITSLICLISLDSFGQDTTCKSQDLGKVEFKRNSSKLTASAKARLDSLIVIINSQIPCEVLATSYSADLCAKCGALSWDRQNAVIRYLAKKSIAANRLRSFTNLKGTADSVTLTLTSWPLTNQSPPHPKLRHKKSGD